MAYAKSKEQSDSQGLLRSYFDGLNAIGNIPVSLGQWELTGSSALIDEILEQYIPLEQLMQLQE